MTAAVPTRLAGLIEFLDRSPSPFHVVASAVEILESAGFSESVEGDASDHGYARRDGALIAWRLPAGDRAPDAFRIIGAHTDSPGLRVKPAPDISAYGWAQLAVEIYGGVLLNSWLDRDLGIAGRVVDASGGVHLVSVTEPVARVPQLAIHLDRAVTESGLVLDRHSHLTPVWGIDGRVPAFAEWIAEQAGIDRTGWWELCLVDIEPARVIGVDRSLLASGRLDNQVSCWAAITALAAVGPTETTATVVVLNDHEEVGSASATGASGAFLERLLERLVLTRGGTRHQLLAALDASECVSADNAHAIHPNYPERHDPNHPPIVNRGPAIKINVNQRYATSARTASSFQSACDSAGVPYQVFSSRNNMPCGSTIGPLTATRLGIDTVDVGVPQLSMHSARELCGVDDPLYLLDALSAFVSRPPA